MGIMVRKKVVTRKFFTKIFGPGAIVEMTRGSNAIIDIAMSYMNISEFASPLGCVNHLRAFIYMWSFFHPLCFILANGCLTSLGSLLITHGIGTMFQLADGLNDPFRTNLQDSRLSRVLAKHARDVLYSYMEVYGSPLNVVTGRENTSSCLSQPFNSRNETKEKQKCSQGRLVGRRSSVQKKRGRGQTLSDKTNVLGSRLKPCRPVSRDESRNTLMPVDEDSADIYAQLKTNKRWRVQTLIQT